MMTDDEIGERIRDRGLEEDYIRELMASLGFDPKDGFTMEGIEACKRNGLQFQVHFSAQPMNYQELPAVIEWSHGLGARVLNVFFMVCTGRGEELTDITPAQYEEVLSYLIDCQDNYKGMLVRARCAPHWPTKRTPTLPSPKRPGTLAAAVWRAPTMRASPRTAN